VTRTDLSRASPRGSERSGSDVRTEPAPTPAPRQNPRHADANGQRSGKGQRAGKGRRRQRPPYPGNGQNRQHAGHGQAEGRSQSHPEKIATLPFMREPVRERPKSPADAGGAAR